LCVAPRPAGTVDPFTGNLYGDRPGTAIQEKSWVRSWIDETYLWYQEVPYPNAADYATPQDYFDVLKTSQITPSGKPKDRFHFTYNTTNWVALSQAGVELGYGFELALLSTVPPRKALIAYTEPGTPASDANILRGAEILTVDGVDLVNGSNFAALNAGLFPSGASTHTLMIRDPGGATRSVTLTAGAITKTPVQNVKTLPAPNNTVGYLQFNDHIATSEQLLIAAINQLKTANVTDLILDIRYNGGGYLDIASELAFMIAGPTATSGKTFERLIFNDKNPFGLTAAQRITPFHNVAQGFSATQGQVLPFLGLTKVYVLAGAGTCSASEAIINGLRGIGIQVEIIGSTSCGKPYGFLPTDNCSTTYFAIQFSGVNDQGFGDYADGISPTCQVADDFGHLLGDPSEGRLAAALQRRNTGTCPPATFSALRSIASIIEPEPQLFRSVVRENRIYRLK
jgi:carboxyl-terminal processing protease